MGITMCGGQPFPTPVGAGSERPHIPSKINFSLTVKKLGAKLRDTKQTVVIISIHCFIH